MAVLPPHPLAMGTTHFSKCSGSGSKNRHADPGKYAVLDPESGKYNVVLEGNFWPSVTKTGNWYDVPYKIMLPKKGVGANLLVCVAFSTSAVAYRSVLGSWVNTTRDAVRNKERWT